MILIARSLSEAHDLALEIHCRQRPNPADHTHFERFARSLCRLIERKIGITGIDVDDRHGDCGGKLRVDEG